MKIFRYALFTIVTFVAGCYLIDSGIEWKGGPYQLGWIDDPKAVTLSFAGDSEHLLERIDSVVFAVGWNGRYLIAKQHPGGNREITNYFVIDSANDYAAADPAQVVTGPLNEGEFQKMSSELGLPKFSKKLDALE
ncbi:hypothetical protein [Pseudoduganella namucuonensis]|uniref:hypothetical protein n=1 Tax=Pseudoduganella namucuonensis TaxID=1035707 RepID=UPI0011609C86|nr:hypothetical protein [Pseudoduganella namucuonensis]